MGTHPAVEDEKPRSKIKKDPLLCEGHVMPYKTQEELRTAIEQAMRIDPKKVEQEEADLDH